MKKILIILVVILLLVGCGKPHKTATQPQYQVEYAADRFEEMVDRIKEQLNVVKTYGTDIIYVSWYANGLEERVESGKDDGVSYCKMIRGDVQAICGDDWEVKFPISAVGYTSGDTVFVRLQLKYKK